MVELILILAFATAVFAIVITPGADMTIILTSALSGGRSAGLAAVGGVATGGLAHILFSVAGLTAIVAAVPAALTVLGWIGAAYLFLRSEARRVGKECVSRVRSRGSP